MNMTDMIEVMANELAYMRDEVTRLKRENSILRSELKRSMVSGMPDDEAEEAAEQYIVYLIAHNEGAE
jgi:hypothetical protein